MTLWVRGAVALGLAALACSGSERPGSGGSIEVNAGGLGVPNITRVTAELQPAGVAADLVANGSGGWRGTLTAPPGPQTLTVRAWDGDVLMGQGSVEVTILAGSTASAVVALRDLRELPPVGHGPVILSVVASDATPAVGEPVTLSVNAVDPDGDLLSYAWTQSCSAGGFTAPTSRETGWSSSAAGACTIGVTVVANGASATKDVTLVVEGTTPTGNVSVDAYFAERPLVEMISMVGYFTGPQSGWVVSRSGTWIFDGSAVNTDATLPVDFFPGQAQQFKVYYTPLPYVAAEMSITMVDDCGGSSSLLHHDGGGMADWLWRAPSTAGVTSLCTITLGLDYRGEHDEYPLVALVTGCPDDAWEPNDDVWNARYFGSYAGAPLGLDGLYAHDADFFAFSVEGSVVLRVTADSADALPVTLYDVDRVSPIASGMNVVDLTTSPGAIRRVYVRVGAGAAAAQCGSSYTLTVGPPTP